MREIKFRAWDKENKIMHQPVSLLSNWDNSTMSYKTEAHQFNYMQFTGLLDKHGKEIYEGDIVIFHYLDAKEENNQVTESVPVPIKSIWWFAQAIKAYQITGIEFEIIGNIYENPELIK